MSFYRAIRYPLSPFVMVHPVVEKTVMSDINKLIIANPQTQFKPLLLVQLRGKFTQKIEGCQQRGSS
jgi:hypothetical protein